MAVNQAIQGGANTIAELQILNNPDLPVVDSNRVRGGAWAFDTIEQRNSIPMELRKANVTRCYIASEEKIYFLKNGISNSNWVLESTVQGSNSNNNNNNNSGTGTGGSNGTGSNTTTYLASSVPSTLNKNMPALATTTDNSLATNTGLLAKPVGYVEVVVGGTLHNVEETKTGDCYFSADGGATAKTFATLAIGDKLYWNGSIAGFQLSATHKISFMYDVLDTNVNGGNNNPTQPDDFVFVQTTPSTHWIIDHPSTDPKPQPLFVEVDANGQESEIEVEYVWTSATRIEVYFDEPMTGKAYVPRQ